MHTDHVDSTLTLSKTHVYSFFFIFSYIYINYYIWKYAQTMSTVSHTVNDSLCHVYSFFLIFYHFLTTFTLITILRNVHKPCKHYPNIVNNSLHHVYSFFPDFSWFSGYICINYHIEKCAQTMSCYLTIVIYHVYFFFLISPNFLAIFALVTILENAHRPCNQCPNIMPNSLHHPYFSSDFITIFCVKMQNLSYWQFVASIPVTHSSAIPFWGLFWYLHWNINILKFWPLDSTGMVLESVGMTGIPQESVGHQ